MNPVRSGSRAFALAEAMTLVVVCVVAIAVLAVASKRSRSLASLGESMANLRLMHQAAMSFGDDNASRFATFSWRKGNDLPTQYPDLRFASTDLQAAANQAIDIIRRRANFAAMPTIQNWIPHLSYSHLVVADYLGQELPMRRVISPEDPLRLGCALDRSQWAGAGPLARWAFSSSYETPCAFWASPDSGPDAITQGGSYSSFFVPSAAQYGQRRLDEVVYPSNKAIYYDRHQRHFGPRQGFFMHDEARVPVATVDGAVSVRRGLDSNKGWNPGNPTSPTPTYVYYDPPPIGQFAWDPPALNGGSDGVVGRYRFTRKALAGRDVDGPEVH